MKSYTVGELKAHFSAVLSQVKNGESVEVLYGRAKEPVAMFVPKAEKKPPRKLGILAGKMVFKEKGDGKITLEEFLGI
ncbi:MAG: prevent-host-death protein [Candidatus Margulisbacteria bacterium]|jgi:antitoxin (DNA-binding transcriptional repressor) of toxin-antitoxin stability system|nr:prevent-host-death protein [Candidatus Margulisiibacteriota bacterium]